MATLVKMSQGGLERKYASYNNVKSDVAANVNTASADVIPVGGFAAGAFKSATVGANALTFYGAEDIGGTFTQIYDSTGSAVSLTAANSIWFDLPSACFSVPFLKIVNAGGAITNGLVTLKG